MDIFTTFTKPTLERAGEGEVRGATCRGAVCALLTRRRRLYAPGTLPCPCRWGILALEAAPAEAVWS